MGETSGSPRVLVVDDQSNWRELLRELLEPEYAVETASSYNEAKDLLKQRAFDVVVTDQRLVDTEKGDIQGILLLDDVKALQDGTRAIVVTGYPTIGAAKAAMRERGAYDYLLKYPEEGGPFEYHEYRKIVGAAAEEASKLRQKVTTVEFSLSSIAANLTYVGLTQEPC